MHRFLISARRLALGLLLIAVLPGAAQNFDLGKNPQSLITVDGLWRFHPGDDARWAEPGFDDSAWPLLRSDRSWSEQGYPQMGGYAWYRFTLHIPAGSPPVSLSLPPVFTGYALYVDGVRAGSYGAADAQFFVQAPRSQSFPLTTVASPAARTLHLALRVWHSPLWASYAGGGPRGAAVAGDAGLIAQRQHTIQQEMLVQNVDLYARLLLLPALLVDGMYLVANVVLAALQFGWWPAAPNLFDYRLHLAPFDFSLYTIFNILFLVAMLAFLIRRFSLARRQEERLLGELEAARQVQQLLVPECAASIPGFALDSVYVPAETVGGDFFQQIPDGLGGVLIVVGDVAGKGLPAAMMVSVLVGAIRAETGHTHDPAALLNVLNDRMLGHAHAGFSTCLAAHIAVSGETTVANAGHIPPWRNGHFLELEGSLPLGIVSNPGYSSETLLLQAGDRLTFVSDGVVEARNSAGELFGFERAGAISTESAPKIAQAAQAFGQEDDISVVTITRLPISEEPAQGPAEGDLVATWNAVNP